MITPTRYPRLTNLGEGNECYYTFYFKVDTALPAENFMQIYYPEYTSLSVG
jgi:hypothetical protein